MSKGIAKSPEMIAKEAEIKTLVAKIKKTRTTLKSLKTRLTNSQEEFVRFQTRMQTEMLSRMENVHKVINEILKYAEKLKKASFLSKADRIGIKELIEALNNMPLFGEGFDDYLEKKQKAENGEFDFDEDAKAKAKDLFKEFNVEPPKEEQRKIRQVFISLSSKFHPDKARNDKDRADFHILMQEINTAYQSHDIDKLLEIERVYVHSEAIDLTGKAITVDVLTQEVKRLIRELEFLEGQVKRTSGEIKNFRQSDLGKALTSKNKLEKEGAGIDTEIKELDAMASQMTILHEAMKDSWDKQYMSPKFYDALMSDLNSPSEDIEDDDGDFDFGDIFGGDFGEEDDDDDEMGMSSTFSEIFGTNNFDELEPVKNPRFKYGETVKVMSNIRPEFYPQLNLKGFTGRILESYMDEGEECYVIEYDPASLEKIPAEYVDIAIAAGHSFDEYTFGRNDLKKVKLAFDDDKATQMRYKLMLQSTFSEEEPEIQKVIIDALLQDNELGEMENWVNYLGNKLRLPLDGKSLGLLEDIKKGVKMKILKIAGVHAEVGIIVECLVVKEQYKMPHPLLDLTISKKADKKIGVILEAYSIWAQSETVN